MTIKKRRTKGRCRNKEINRRMQGKIIRGKLY
jgi:hypothetical protein